MRLEMSKEQRKKDVQVYIVKCTKKKKKKNKKVLLLYGIFF